MTTQRMSGMITVNGEQRAVPEDRGLSTLLNSLDISLAKLGVAVALNGEVVPRAEWATTRLADGDRVEIVRPVQGG